MMKPKFDGYAAQYDTWFMENDNLFQSELRLFQTALGDIAGKRVLSVGCGSGLFESMIDCSGIEGIEPSHDMGAIAQKRGVLDRVRRDRGCRIRRKRLRHDLSQRQLQLYGGPDARI